MNAHGDGSGERRGVPQWVVPLIVLSAAAGLAVVAVVLVRGCRPRPAPPSPVIPTTYPATAPATRPGADERVEERNRMVEDLLRYHHPRVTDDRVLTAMRAVPRHRFVPPRRRRAAYDDTPLPIGSGQTISQPYIVALMSQLLQTQPGDNVLEIGTGSGYQAAVLGEMGCTVHTIEIFEELGTSAAARLEAMRYAGVAVKVGDGYFGWTEHAPYDRIVVTCAATHVPPALIEQLKPGGRMCIPVGAAYGTQDLVVVTKRADGSVRSRSIIPVRFVPLRGGHERKPGG